MIERDQTDGELALQESFSQGVDYSDALALLEAGWGSGEVHDLRLELWPLPDRRGGA